MDVQTENTAAAAWRERIGAQQASGQRIRGWCRENGCREHAFYWWRARLGLSPAAGKRRGRPRAVRPMGFARLVVEPPAPSSAEPIRLSLAGGRELTLPASMSVERIATLVRAIEGVA
jgi:hypothetical protein